MSRIARATALLGTGAALSVALTGAAHAAPAPDMNAKAKKASCYVVVYSKKNFKGNSACIGGSIKNLKGIRWPGTHSLINDDISSIVVDKACDLQLWQNANYKAAHTSFKRTEHRPGIKWRIPALTTAHHGVGDNRTSSIKWNCRIDV